MKKEDINYFIELKKLSKSFGSKKVLNDLDLSIPRGKISFLIGRSGEGKSVTIKHLIGILHPDSGEIWIDGFPMHNASENDWEKVRTRIGILFQEVALFDSLNVFENVSFPIVNHGHLSSTIVKNKVTELLDMVGLKKVENKYPPELSIGEKKRVGLARALALKPDLLLFDEPTTSMDPLVADLIDNLILSTQKAMPHLTTVVISHDVTSMSNVADKIFLLHQGHIYHSGTPHDFQTSTDPLVKQFMTGAQEGPLDIMLI